MMKNMLNIFSIYVLLIISAIDYSKAISIDNFTTIYFATDDSTFETGRIAFARYNIHNAIEQINLDPDHEVGFIDVSYVENRPDGYWLLVGSEEPNL